MFARPRSDFIMTSVSAAPLLTPKSLIVGFAGGFVSTVVFHQLALLALNEIGVTQAQLWVVTPVPPFGVPRIISLAFWGGVFGLFYPLMQARFSNAATFILVGAIFGAIVPTLCSWYLVNAIRGVALGPNGGWALPAPLVGPIVNGAWGFGTALFQLAVNRR
jgi:hypothetical protein